MSRSPRTGVRARARIVGLGLALCLLLGLAGAFLSGPLRHDEPDAPLLVFSSVDVLRGDRLTHSIRVTLHLEDAAELGGFLHADQLAPGDAVQGDVVLDVGAGLPPGFFQLSLNATVDLTNPGAARLDDELLVESLLYGGVELLSPGSAAHLRLDRTAPLGNNDGQVSLRELQNGIVGLLPPSTAAQGGTTLALRVRFDPTVTGNGSQFAGQVAQVAFAFTLEDHRILTPPQVVIDGPTLVTSSQTANVTFLFSQPMHVDSVLGAISGHGGFAPEWDANNSTLWLNRSVVTPGTITLTINATAHDLDGLPLASAASHVITVPPPATKPLDPPVVTISHDASGVHLEWTPPADDGGASISVYTVYESKADGPFSQVALTGDLKHDITALENGTKYAYQVSAWNEKGESPKSPPQALIFGSPTTTLTTSPSAPDGLGGWFLSQPTVTLTPQPAGASVWWTLDGGAEQAYAGPFTVPTGPHNVTYGARLKDTPDELPHTRAFLVDPDPPALSGGTLPPFVDPGVAFPLSVLASDAMSGVESVAAILHPSGGTAFRVPLGLSGPIYFTTLSLGTLGEHTVLFEARDAAGHIATLSAGTIQVGTPLEQTDEPPPAAPGQGPGPGTQPTGPTDPAATDPAAGGEGPGGASGGAGSQDAPRPPPPRVSILDESGRDVRGDGVDGNITVRLEHLENSSRSFIVVIYPNGTEVVFAEGETEARWDTTNVPDGTYTIETRERQGDGSTKTVASRKVVVWHPRSSVQETTLALAATVAAATVTTAATGGLTTMGSNVVTSRTFSFVDTMKNYLFDLGEDRFRERTKRFGARYLSLPGLIAGGLAVVLLAAFYTLSEIDGFALGDYLAKLPLVAGVTILYFSLAYGGEVLLARGTGAKAEFRLLPMGGIALAVSSIFFRQSFGYAGFVEKDEAGDDDHLPQRRLGGLRVLAIFGLYLACMLPFLAWWAFTDDASVLATGLGVATTVFATSTMPLRPLPGSELWRWRKDLAIVFLLCGFVLYYCYQLALVGVYGLFALSFVGAVAYGGGWWFLAAYAKRIAGEGLTAVPSDETH